MTGGYLDPLVGGGLKEVIPFVILVIILNGQTVRAIWLKKEIERV
ncbi:MAG: hypothetical protein KatS3mg080_0459 [Anoxybacillus sp.]|nr:MAG: hypothetical protein KatS3mg080_0459 [Anoxybacillus sp.]